MPDQRQPGIFKEIRVRDAVGAQAIDELVMGADEGQLQAGHEGVHVVAGIADQGDSLLVAREVAIDAGQEFRRIGLIEQVRGAHRATAVEAFEVSARRANVAEHVDVGVGAQRRAIGGDVVGHILPEERLAGLDLAVSVALTAIADATGHAERQQAIAVEGGGRQVREHAAVAASLDDGSVDGTARRKAQIPRRTSGAASGSPLSSAFRSARPTSTPRRAKPLSLSPMAPPRSIWCWISGASKTANGNRSAQISRASSWPPPAGQSR